MSLGRVVLHVGAIVLVVGGLWFFATSNDVEPQALHGVWVSQGLDQPLVFELRPSGDVLVQSPRTSTNTGYGRWQVRRNRFTGEIPGGLGGVLPVGHRWDDQIVSVSKSDLVLRNSANEIEVYARAVSDSLAQTDLHAPSTLRVGNSSISMGGVSRDELVGPCDVTRVVDGDTVYVRCGNEFAKVRLLNIDTPERGQYLYNEATNAMERLINDQPVYLAFETPGQPSYGKYKRLLAYLYNAEGENLNLEMIREGWSHFYTEYGEGRFSEEFSTAARRAALR